MKRFLNEIAVGGDTSSTEIVAQVLDYRFVDLDRDGWLELVCLIGGGPRPGEGLVVVFQAPDRLRRSDAHPADRLAPTHEGFGMQGMACDDVRDLNAVLRDLDHDGTYELIIPQQLGAFEGRTCPQPLFPEVYSWSGADYDKVSTRFPEFYRDEVLPRLERRLQQR